MNSLVVCVAFVAAISCAWAASTNEWGPYYTLPSKFHEYETAFYEAYKSYQGQSNKMTKCAANDALFERWLQSSKNKNYYILSYFCKTKGIFGYEHLKVELNSDLSFKKVLTFKAKLKDYGISGAGSEYATTSEGGKTFQEEMLNNVTGQLQLEKDKSDATLEYCPNPSNQTGYSLKTKTFNGLKFYQFPISCGQDARDYVEIEVVKDATFKKGNATLIAVGSKYSNLDYIKKMLEEEKQKNGHDFLAASLVSVVVLPIIMRLV